MHIINKAKYQCDKFDLKPLPIRLSRAFSTHEIKTIRHVIAVSVVMSFKPDVDSILSWSKVLFLTEMTFKKAKCKKNKFRHCTSSSAEHYKSLQLAMNGPYCHRLISALTLTHR